MGHITRRSGTAGGWHYLESVEVGTPFFGHRARIVEVVLVQLLDIGGVTPEQV
jgi:hypothetical protein